MTIIITYISNLGIVHLSDSNLTSRNGYARPGKKVFPISSMNAAVAVAGCYQVGGIPLDEWMPKFIESQSDARCASLRDFSYQLKDQVEAERLSHEHGNMFHIAGYETESDSFHPEFWFVRDFEHINPDSGSYEGETTEFLISEDFWNRDFSETHRRLQFYQGHSQMYFNGTPPGRISFFALQNHIQSLLQDIWHKPDWGFRPPKSLNELASLLKLYVEFVNTLYVMSDYQAPFIGGEVQIETIPPPSPV